MRPKRQNEPSTRHRSRARHPLSSRFATDSISTNRANRPPTPTTSSTEGRGPGRVDKESHLSSELRSTPDRPDLHLRVPPSIVIADVITDLYFARTALRFRAEVIA